MEILLFHLTISFLFVNTYGYDFRTINDIVKDDQPILLVAARKNILKISTTSGDTTRLFDTGMVEDVEDVDYDFAEKKLYFIDQDKHGIFV